jgi:glycosyltransferase involved in cell wall biosynthesis
VAVTGFVTDMAPVLQRAAVSVAPLVYGVGIQNKVLESMATATPVVATPLAVRALSAQAGRDVAVAAEAPAFARAVLDLLGDPEGASRLGMAGRAYVERHHRWSDSVRRLEGAYAHARERYRRRAGR